MSNRIDLKKKISAPFKSKPENTRANDESTSTESPLDNTGNQTKLNQTGRPNSKLTKFLQSIEQDESFPTFNGRPLSPKHQQPPAQTPINAEEPKAPVVPKVVITQPSSSNLMSPDIADSDSIDSIAPPERKTKCCCIL